MLIFSDKIIPLHTKHRLAQSRVKGCWGPPKNPDGSL